MLKRKLLIGSLLVGVALMAIGASITTVTPALYVVGFVWIWVVPLIMAGLYAKELEFPTGQVVLLGLFLPGIVPAIVAAWSRPAPPDRSPDTKVYGKTIREWGLGDPVRTFTTKKLLGRGGRILVQAADGFICEDHGAPRTVPWKGITEVYQNLLDQSVNGVQTARTRSYTAVLADGARVSFDQRYGYVEDLGKELQLKVAEALLPAAVHDIEQGKSLSFGPVALDRSSISVKDKNLPWEAVADVTLDSGYVVVSKLAGNKAEYAAKRTGEIAAGLLTRISGTATPVLSAGHGVQWARVLASSVPNLLLLLHVSQGILSFVHATERIRRGGK